MKSITDLKNDKAHGQDRLHSELYQCHPEIAAEIYSHSYSLLRYGMVMDAK